MSGGAWDAMLAHEQAERERAAGISSVAGLAALRAGARRAGLEYGQAAPDDVRPQHDCADNDTWPCSAVNAARATEREIRPLMPDRDEGKASGA
jgi:hypothetical protein